jgi:HSP20 family protein
MFEVTRHDPIASSRGIRELFDVIAGDPLLRASRCCTPTDEGTLPLDISEDDGDVVVRASLPGFDRNDVDVQVHDGVLTIRAEHSAEKETTDEKFYRRERRSGALSRRVALPATVSGMEATAELKDGILTLRLPQAEEARPRRITIN